MADGAVCSIWKVERTKRVVLVDTSYIATILQGLWSCDTFMISSSKFYADGDEGHGSSTCSSLAQRSLKPNTRLHLQSSKRRHVFKFSIVTVLQTQHSQTASDFVLLLNCSTAESVQTIASLTDYLSVERPWLFVPTTNSLHMAL